MTGAGQILLIACYELGHQPLSVAWPMAFLERAGYHPAVLDLSVEPLDADKVTRALLIAVSVPMHTALRIGVAAAAKIRELNLAAHICFYGHYAALNASALLNTSADSVLAGEIEEELVSLVRHAEAAGPGGPGGPADSVGFDRRVPHVGLRQTAAPDRRQWHAEPKGPPRPPRPAALAGTPLPAKPHFPVPGPRHALAVARALHAEFPGVTFDFTAKVEHLLRERARLAELTALGCAFVVSAAESLDDRVLGYLAKGHTRADLVAALAATRAAGIALRPTWVAFTPWTTLDGYREWLDFLAAERLVDHVDPVQYGIRLLVPPGSLLLDLPEMRAHVGELVPGGFHH